MSELPIIAPSILSADFANLEKDVTRVIRAGAQWVHVDVMDGVFVPNITVGPLIVRALKRITEAPLDVHLMIAHPQKYIRDFADAGASVITVHVEAEDHLHRCSEAIRAAGCQAGVSLNPATSLSLLDGCLPYVDLVLVMSVNPGFGGQVFIPESLQRVRKLDRIRKDSGLAFKISVDGGVTLENAPGLVEEGADVLVAGNTVFKSSDPEDTIARLLSIRRPN